jgi:hypothetical protein
MFSHFDSVPSLRSTAHLLAEAGALVDVFTPFNDNFLPPSPSHERITVHTTCARPRSQRVGLTRFLPGRLVRRLVVNLENRKTPFTAVIATDAESLIYAHDDLFRGFRIPFVYFSLEIKFRAECTRPDQLAEKKRECELSRGCRMVLIQDSDRAGILARENGIADDLFRILPNSPLGEPSVQRSSWLRDRLNIPPDKVIILHAGAPYHWAGLPRLLQAAAHWPKEWVLVVQMRPAFDRLSEEQRNEIGPLLRCPQALLFPDPLSASEYPSLIRSADIGCAFYYPQPYDVNWPLAGDNLRFVGRSSGKAAYYLLHGLPVITNGACNLSNIIQQYSCGEVLDSPLETKEGIERIMQNYSSYSENATKCFADLFYFRKYFEPIKTELFSM